MNILSHDPGTTNYGWCVNRYHAKGFEVLEVGQMSHRISAVHEGLDDAVAAYLDEVDGIVTRHKVDRMCFERFQARSTGLYNIIECINIMMGTLMGHYAGSVKFDAFYASNWKNSVNRRLQEHFGFKLDIPPADFPPELKTTEAQRKKMGKEAYKEILAKRQVINKERAALPSGYRNLFPGVSDHLVDAFFINVCGWHRAAGTKPFDGYTGKWFELAGKALCAAA